MKPRTKQVPQPGQRIEILFNHHNQLLNSNRVYLGTCCNWSENGRLQAHGKVEGEDEGREVDAEWKVLLPAPYFIKLAIFRGSPCERKPLPAEQVDQVIVRTPQKGEAGQGESTAQREQEGELSGVEHKDGEKGYCESKADHAQNQTGHESNDSLLLGQAWQPLICLSGKPVLRSTTATASIVNLRG